MIDFDFTDFPSAHSGAGMNGGKTILLGDQRPCQLFRPHWGPSTANSWSQDSPHCLLKPRSPLSPAGPGSAVNYTNNCTKETRCWNMTLKGDLRSSLVSVLKGGGMGGF